MFKNDKCGRRALRNLRQCPATAGIETVLVGPLRSRRFADAPGRLAKNDRVECVAADTVLPRRADILGPVPGCGCLMAACLCADMLGLGAPGRRPAVSLLGLAPAVATPDGTWAAAASAPGVTASGESPAWRPSPRSAGSPTPRLACVLGTLLRQDRSRQAEPPCTVLQNAA